MAVSIDPTFTFTIDRASLSLPALVLSGREVAAPSIGVESYSEPPMQARVMYAGNAGHMHGDTALGWSWQQTVHTLGIFTTADSEADSRALLAELRTAITRLSYTVTVRVDGAPAESWSCDPGSLEPDGQRSYVDIAHHNPRWVLTIPAYPLRGA